MGAMCERMLLQQSLAGAHLADEEKRQWLEAMQDAAAHRARCVRVPHRLLSVTR